MITLRVPFECLQYSLFGKYSIHHAGGSITKIITINANAQRSTPKHLTFTVSKTKKDIVTVLLTFLSGDSGGVCGSVCIAGGESSLVSGPYGHHLV